MGPRLRVTASLAAIVALLGLGACGGDGGGDDEEDAIRETVTRFVRAGNAQEFATVCALLAESEVRSIESEGGESCARVLRRLSGGPGETDVRVDEIRVSDERASVDATFVRDDGTRDPQTLRLVKEDDDWKIAAVGG